MEISKDELKEIISEAIVSASNNERLSWTIEECAQRSGIGENKLRELIAAVNSDIPHIKVGKKTLIPVDLFHNWLNELARNKKTI